MPADIRVDDPDVREIEEARQSLEIELQRIRESLESGGSALSHWFTTETHGLVASVDGDRVVSERSQYR